MVATSDNKTAKTREMRSCIHMQNHARQLGYDLMTSGSDDLRVSACQVPATDDMSTDFGADSPIRFLLACIQTDRQMRLNALPMLAAIYLAWVTKYVIITR